MCIKLGSSVLEVYQVGMECNEGVSSLDGVY